jgi:serine acetyltransferase
MSRNNPIFGILYIFNRAIYPFVRMYGGVEISPKSQIGPGLCIMHFGPTILAKELIAGENLSILHGTTIASSSNGTPKIGNNVSIGAGATIVGNLVIGDNVTVSAGAVVTKNLPANCVAIGIPARIVNLRNFDKLDE